MAVHLGALYTIYISGALNILMFANLSGGLYFSYHTQDIIAQISGTVKNECASR